MRADRMLSILLHLQTEGKLTSSELAHRLEVSNRTIIRDMEALSMSGVPVYAERGSQGGWLLSEGYQTKLTGMKDEELVSLIISTQPNVLRELGIKEQYDKAFRKLLASSSKSLQHLANTVKNKIHIDGAGWHKANETFPFLSIIQEAVWGEQQVCIHYQHDADISVRIVNPLGLVVKRSVWYLVALAEDEYRTYRISRIVKAEPTNKPFIFPAGFHLAHYWDNSTEQHL